MASTPSQEGPEIVVIGRRIPPGAGPSPSYRGSVPFPTVYGSTNGATYDEKYKLYLLPAVLTAQQAIAVAYNETMGIDKDHKKEVARSIISVLLNNRGRRFLAASPLTSYQGNQIQYAFEAYQEAVSGRDLTNGSTNWIMRPTSSTAPWLGLPVQYQIGPFGSAGTNNHYVVFFKDPAFSRK